MATYGSYEAVRELHRGRITTVSTAKQTRGDPAPHFAIKACEPFPGSLSEDALELVTKRFLQAAKTQQTVGQDSAGYWAPIHECGPIPGGAYYVSDHYDRSVGRLVIGHVKLNGHALYTIVRSVVKGLLELQSTGDRPHGNLKPENVFLMEGQKGILLRAVLTDPLDTDSLTSDIQTSTDLHSLGELIHHLILQKPFVELGGWPVPESPHWAHLGKKADPWRRLCNRLLDPDLAKQCPTLQEIVEQELPVLAVRPSKTWPKVVLVGGLLIVAVAAGVYMTSGPGEGTSSGGQVGEVFDPVKWEQICTAYEDWVGPLHYVALNGDRLAPWAGDEHLKKILEQLSAITDADQVDPGKMIGRGGSRKGMAKPIPPEARSPEVIAKTNEAYRIVVTIQTALRRWPILQSIQEKAKQYEEAGWDKPAGYLNDLIKKTQLKWVTRGKRKEDFVTAYNQILANQEPLGTLFLLDPPTPQDQGGLRRVLLDNAVTYLKPPAGRGRAPHKESLTKRFKELLVVDQLIRQSRGVLSTTLTEIDGIRSQFGEDQLVDQFEQNLNRYGNNLRSTLNLIEKGVPIEEIGRGIVGVQKRLTSLQNQVEDFLQTPPLAPDPCLAWRAYGNVSDLPDIGQIRSKMNQLRVFNDESQAGEIEAELSRVGSQIKDLLAYAWVRQHQREINNKHAVIQETLGELNRKADQRIAYLGHPLPEADPRAVLAQTIQEIQKEIDLLDEGQGGRYESELNTARQLLAESQTNRRWIRAFRDEIQSTTTDLRQHLDALNQQVFAQLDPRGYWERQELVDMIASELENPSASGLEPGVAKQLQNQLNAIKDRIDVLVKPSKAWSPQTRGWIEAEHRGLKQQIEQLADRVISDQRTVFREEWDRLAQKIEAAIAFRQKELDDPHIPDIQEQFQALESEKNDLFSLAWPDDPQGRSEIRAAVPKLKNRANQFFMQLDPRPLWEPKANQRISDIRSGIDQLKAKAVPGIDDLQKQAQSLAVQIISAPTNRWNERSAQKILNEIRDHRAGLETLYRTIYSKLDPRLKYQWVQIANQIAGEIEQLQEIDKTTARALLARLNTGKEMANQIKQKSWDEQSKSRIEEDVRSLQSDLRDIYAAAINGLPGLDGASSTILNRVWRRRRQELVDTPGDVVALQAGVNGLRVLLRDRVESLSKPLSREAHPRGWRNQIATQAISDKREDIVRVAFEPWLNGAVSWEAATERTRWESLLGSYQTWRGEAVAMMEDFRAIEDAFDNAYGLDHTPKGYKESIRQLYTQWQAREVFRDFREALGPVVTLNENLLEINDTKDPSRLRELADKGKAELNPAVTFAAWRKLGNTPRSTWPSGVIQLKKEYELRQWLGVMIRDSIEDTSQQQALGDELQAEGHKRWARCFSGLSQPQEVEEAIRLAPRFAVDMTKLNPETQFNIKLAEFKQGITDLPFKTPEEQVRAAAIGFRASLQEQPGGIASRGMVKELLKELDQLLAEDPDDQGQAVDLTQSGIESSVVWDDQAWTKTADEDQARIVYTWEKGRTKHRIEFVRVEANQDVPKSFYLSTTEVSLGLIKDLTRASRLGAPFNVLLGNPKWHGPKAWRMKSKKLRVNKHKSKKVWTPPDTRLVSGGGQVPDYHEKVSPENPSENHPMQYITPEAAVFFTRLLGCRLPTSAEWAAALEVETQRADLSDYISLHHPNLRDVTWTLQKEYADKLQGMGVRIQTPDQGRFGLGENQSEPLSDAGQWDYDDGVLWFDHALPSRIRPGEVFNHLIGNVAEYFFEEPEILENINVADLAPSDVPVIIKSSLRSGHVGVIGGSAQSPRTIPIDEAQALETDARRRAFSDVGLRLVFSAPRQSFKSKLEILLTNQGYLTASR